jgi:hypothetical protein
VGKIISNHLPKFLRGKRFNLNWRWGKSSPTISLNFLGERDSTSTGGGENHLQPEPGSSESQEERFRQRLHPCSNIIF